VNPPRDREFQAAVGALSFDPDKPLSRGDANLNPPDLGLGELLLEDYRTHGHDPRAAGFWALAVHRLGNARMDVRTRALRVPLSAMYRLAYHAVIAAFGIDLPYNSKIGRRFHIEHHGGLHLGAKAVGDDVRVRHTATIGLARRSEQTAAPVIGNGVEIGPGACIVGAIHLGDGSYVGANTVVADSLAPGAAALGVPGHVVDLDRHRDAATTTADAVRRSR
jgi:serine O-acetyltransferase